MGTYILIGKSTLTALLAVCMLSACGGGSDAGSSVASTYSLGGSITGLNSSGLVLANGTDTLALASGATAFSFGSSSGSYDVTVATQPDGQTCAVDSGSGTLQGNVSSIMVVCRGYMAYVTNMTGNAIAQFSVTSGSGALVPLAIPTVVTTYQPSNIALSWDGKYAYVSHQDSKLIGAYRVNSSGALSLLDSVSAASAGYGLATSPIGDALYCADYGAQSISQFNVGANGIPVAMSSKTVSANVNPTSIAITPNGKYAYAINSSSETISQYSVGINGALTALTVATVSTTALGSNPQALVVDPSSSYVYVTLTDSNKIAQYSIGSTGGLTSMSPASIATDANPRGLVISPNGSYVYVANSGANTITQYVVTGGRLTALATSRVAAGSNPYALAASPDGRYVYVTNYGDNTVSQFSVGSGGGLSAMSTQSVSSQSTRPTGIAVR